MRKKNEKTNGKMNNEKRDAPNIEGVEKHQRFKWLQQSITTMKKQVAQASVVHLTSTEAKEPKVIAALRILVYEAFADAIDEISRMGESTVLETLNRLCSTIEHLYTTDYLRRPTPANLRRLLQKAEVEVFLA